MFQYPKFQYPERIDIKRINQLKVKNRNRKGIIESIAQAQGKSVIATVIDAIESEGSISEAARALGVTSASLHHHLKKHGLMAIFRVKIVRMDEAYETNA